jgi:hypothetical protein
LCLLAGARVRFLRLAGECAVGLFNFANWVLVTIFAVTILWPLNIPLLVLAFRVRLGTAKLPYDEPRELWWRAALGATGLFVLTLAFVLLAYLVNQGAELTGGPRGAVHLTLLLLYVPAAVGFLFWCFAFEDPGPALAVFLLYVGLPALPLLLAGWFRGFWGWLGGSAPWLLSP